MRICLLGESYGALDEGMRKSSFHISRALSRKHQVLLLDIRKIVSRSFWRDVKRFKPQIVHYIHGSSLRSFMLLKIISFYIRDAKTIISMMRPNFSFLSKRLIHLFKPDLTLVQSNEMEQTFEALKCRTGFLSIGGVDTEKFNPGSKKNKEEMRVKYGIPENKFVILHIGSIKEGRNLLWLKSLQEKSNDIQVFIVGAVSQGIQRDLLHQLENAGCVIWTRYFDHIEEIYTLSDCYVFPVLPKKNVFGINIADCIEMPLSVLEAMSCNLPVVTTKFGALPRIFKEGDGLIFVEKEEEFINAVKKIKSAGMSIKTRDNVLQYSWEKIAERLEGVYEELIGQRA